MRKKKEKEILTDGLYRFRASTFLKRLAKLLAKERDKPYPTGNFINARLNVDRLLELRIDAIN